MYRAMLFSAVLFIGSVGIANAQNSTPSSKSPGPSSTSSGQWWDQAQQAVRVLSTAGSANGTTIGSSSTTSASSGPGVSSNGTADSQTSAGSRTARRPAGMPNC